MSVVADVSLPVAEIALPPVPDNALWRFSLAQYHEMVRRGILTEDNPVELWEGLLVQKMPKSRAHCLATELAQEALAPRVPAGWHLEAQESITLSGSEFEPDIVIVRGAARDFVDENPGAADLALVIEVSDSTLARDQGFKKAVYAKAGIPVYWIINLVDRRVEVYTNPGGEADKPDYRQPQHFGGVDNVPLVIGGQEIARIPVRELLP
jgi:Uma2 family endonuclease